MPLKVGFPRPQTLSILDRRHWAQCIVLRGRKKKRLLLFEKWLENLYSKDQNPAAAAAAKPLQSCLTLCDPIKGSSPGSHAPGILQNPNLRQNAWAAEPRVWSRPSAQPSLPDKAYGCFLDSGFSRPQAVPAYHAVDPHSPCASRAARLSASRHAKACGGVLFSLRWPQPECHSLQKAQPGCFSVINHSTEPVWHSLTCCFLCLLIVIIVLKPESSSHNIHGVLKAKIQKQFAIPFSEHVLSELSTMTRPFWVALHSMAHCLIEFRAGCGPCDQFG